jgi:hypothetical protein
MFLVYSGGGNTRKRGDWEMFDTLTWDENNELFVRMSRGHRAVGKRLDDLRDAGEARWRPVIGTACEMTALMTDLAAASQARVAVRW